MFKKDPTRRPSKNIEVEKLDSLEIVNRNPKVTQLTWFGHSTFLLEMEGKTILIDPMFGQVAAPHPMLGANRYSEDLPIKIEQLPYIDFVILSHDHYDHLDYKSIKKLKGKVGAYYTPLGVGNHLASWGISAEKINELNWWDTVNVGDINLVCTPARHFSGRGIANKESTLWASWVIKGEKESVFFSGDSGYGEHFKEIGDKYGPFDIALMECGQYNKSWSAIHMMPEETAQAAVDSKSKLVLPIHWGGFRLAMHSWSDPVERITVAAANLNIPVTTPRIGESLVVGDSIYPQEKWWEEYNVYSK
jgi:L-ascorbate metabolism protein UlaG (beta-lactamase superfamily)